MVVARTAGRSTVFWAGLALALASLLALRAQGATRRRVRRVERGATGCGARLEP